MKLKRLKPGVVPQQLSHHNELTENDDVAMDAEASAIQVGRIVIICYRMFKKVDQKI
jgi:hypothetical protein